MEKEEQKKMENEELEWKRLIALLLLVRQSSAVSKLPTAACQSTSTPCGAFIQPPKNRFTEKSKKYLLVHSRPAGFYARSAILCCLLKAAIFRLLAYCSINMQGRGPIHGDGLSR